MAAHEVVLLSSSPPHVPDSDIISTPPGLYDSHTPWLVPESPDPPSPSKLLDKKPHGLKSGSRAAEIPRGVALGFASAGVLVRERQLSLGEDEGSHAPDEAAKPKNSRKRAPKQMLSGDNANGLPKIPRKRKTKQDTDDGPTVPVQPRGDGVSTDRIVKQSIKANVREDRQSSSENPKKRMTKAPLNNSELINEIMRLKAPKLTALSKTGEAGVMEKAKRLETKLDADGLGKAGDAVEADEEHPAVNKAVTNKPRARKADSRKTAERKPRAARAKTVDTGLAEARNEAKPTGVPEPKARRRAPRDMVETTSKHFSRSKSEAAAVPQKPAEDMFEEALRPQPAMARRLSWTPPKDTVFPPKVPDPSRVADASETSLETVSPALQPSFGKLLDSFGYNKEAPGAGNVPSRAGSGEAFTKRRKLDLVDALNNPVEPSIAEAVPEKQEKAPKKRPRTITDLATAAYRPALTSEAVEPPPIDPKVSAFFAPRAASLAEPEVPEVSGAEKAERTARQKSPVKKADSKAKKTNAKSKKTPKPAAEKLLSPETALLKMNRQDVLFGTSSQLAREDSPTFIRNLQQAIHDSDAMGTQEGSIETLHLKPAALGSGLSLIGRRRGLWAAAARDLEDGILEEEKASEVGEGLSLFIKDSTNLTPSPRAESPLRIEGPAAAPLIVATIPSDGPTPVAERTDVDKGQCVDDVAQTRMSPESFPNARPVSSSSDYIDIDEFDHQYRLSQQQDCAAPPNSTSTVHSSPELLRRTVLQPLTAHQNIPILSKPGFRVKSTLADKSGSRRKDTVSKPAKSPTKRSRSRQPAVSDPEEGSPTLKHLGGRPRRGSEKPRHSQPMQEAVVDEGSVPLKRRRGRPRKDACPISSLGSSEPATAEQDHVRTVSPKARSSSATPRRRKPTHDEEWPHVDDIEDSEKEISPSPPRPKDHPDASPPLTLGLSQIDTAAAPVPSRKRKALPDFPLESLDPVFCCITAAVNAAPPSTDAMRPSWHEKMLLYDPIVVEDFAEWLNAEGVRMDVVVPVPKATKKGSRKKKDADNDEEEARTEVQQLPAWVAQRWCDENSICCIYKESLRNGRRTKG